MFPTFALRYQTTVAHLVLYPWGYFIGYQSVYGIVLKNFHLTDMRVFKVDAEIFQRTVFGIDQ